MAFTSSNGVDYLQFGNSGFSAAQEIRITSPNGGTTFMTIQSGGNVGIGTASPIDIFHVGTANGNIRFGAGADVNSNAIVGRAQLANYHVTGTNAGDFAIRPEATKDIVFGTTPTAGTVGTEKVRITSSGNVGIGTTGPAVKLDVWNSVSTTGAYGVGEFFNTYNNYDANPTVSYPVLSVNRSGKLGTTYTSTFSIGISRYEDVSSYARSQADFMLSHGASSVADTTVMSLRSNGNVGIGTTGPSAKLQISKDDGSNGATGLSDYGMVTTASGGQATLGAEYIGDGFANLNLGSNISGTRRFWHISKRISTYANPHCMEIYYYNGTSFVGPLFTFTTGGNFTATGTKNFEINHPTKPGYKLVHTSLEGPEAGVYYRGETKLIKGQATVKLPDYFEALTRKEGRTIQLTAKGTQPYLLSATEVSKGSFNVFGTQPEGEFFWEVKAIRADVMPLKVEKPKEENQG